MENMISQCIADKMSVQSATISSCLHELSVIMAGTSTAVVEASSTDRRQRRLATGN